jgi:hypothetical protein
MKLARISLFAAIAVAFGLALGVAASAADRNKAIAALKEALVAENAEGVRKACDELIDCGGKEAIEPILSFLPKVQGMSYWQLSGAAAGFKDHAALDELAKFVLSHQTDRESALVRDLLFNLQNNNSPYVELPLAAALDKGKIDLQLMAADQLGTIRTVEAVDALIDALKKHEKDKDPELRRRIEGALSAITGQSLGDVANWVGWWTEQKPKGVPEKTQAQAIGTSSKAPDREWNKVIETLDPRRILVLTADRSGYNDDPVDLDFDKVQNILKDKRIPFTLVKKAEFELDPDSYLKNAWALLVNCNFIRERCTCPGCVPDKGTKEGRRLECNPKCGKHRFVTYRLKPKALAKIKAFVEGGGYLYTEDWGIVEITQQLWGDMIFSGSFGKDSEKPRLVRKMKADKKTPEETITVHLTPVPGVTSHPLMRGVWGKPKKEAVKKELKGGGGETVSRDPDEVRLGDEMLNHLWDIDDESPAIEIKDTSEVTVLLESPDLAQLPNVGAERTAVAVTFKGGVDRRAGATGQGASGGSRDRAGRVLHTMSHFGHQSASEDGQCLYNLLVNFLLESAKAHEGAPELPPMPAKQDPPKPANPPVAPQPAASPAAPPPVAPPPPSQNPPPPPPPAPSPVPPTKVDPNDPNAGRDG